MRLHDMLRAQEMLSMASSSGVFTKLTINWFCLAAALPQNGPVLLQPAAVSRRGRFRQNNWGKSRKKGHATDLFFFWANNPDEVNESLWMTRNMKNHVQDANMVTKQLMVTYIPKWSHWLTLLYQYESGINIEPNSDFYWKGYSPGQSASYPNVYIL